MPQDMVYGYKIKYYPPYNELNTFYAKMRIEVIIFLCSLLNNRKNKKGD